MTLIMALFYWEIPVRVLVTLTFHQVHFTHAFGGFISETDEGLEVKEPEDSSVSLPSDASKRKGKDCEEEDSAFTSLKRERN